MNKTLSTSGNSWSEHTASSSMPAKNEFPYLFGNVMVSNWYRKFLHPCVHQKTYHHYSKDQYSAFRSFSVDDQGRWDHNMFIDWGWSRPSRHDHDATVFYVKTQIKIMASLNILANHTAFCELTTNTELSSEDHRLSSMTFWDAWVLFCMNL